MSRLCARSVSEIGAGASANLDWSKGQLGRDPLLAFRCMLRVGFGRSKAEECRASGERRAALNELSALHVIYRSHMVEKRENRMKVNSLAGKRAPESILANILATRFAANIRRLATSTSQPRKGDPMFKSIATSESRSPRPLILAAPTMIVPRAFERTFRRPLFQQAVPVRAAVARERHPEIRKAIAALERAKTDLKRANHDFGGHRAEAPKLATGRSHSRSRYSTIASSGTLTGRPSQGGCPLPASVLKIRPKRMPRAPV